METIIDKNEFITKTEAHHRRYCRRHCCNSDRNGNCQARAFAETKWCPVIQEQREDWEGIQARAMMHSIMGV